MSAAAMKKRKTVLVFIHPSSLPPSSLNSPPATAGGTDPLSTFNRDCQDKKATLSAKDAPGQSYGIAATAFKL
jgi:hypothetical protein